MPRAAAIAYALLALIALLGVGPVDEGTELTIGGDLGEHSVSDGGGCDGGDELRTKHRGVSARLRQTLDRGEQVVTAGVEYVRNDTGAVSYYRKDVLGVEETVYRPAAAQDWLAADLRWGLQNETGGVEFGVRPMILGTRDGRAAALGWPRAGPLLGLHYNAWPDMYLYATAGASTLLRAAPYDFPYVSGGLGWRGATMRATAGFTSSPQFVFAPLFPGAAGTLDLRVTRGWWAGGSAWLAFARNGGGPALGPPQWSLGLRLTFAFGGPRPPPEAGKPPDPRGWPPIYDEHGAPY